MKYIYSTSQISKLSLTLCTFSVTGSMAGLFLTSRLSILSWIKVNSGVLGLDNMMLYSL